MEAWVELCVKKGNKPEAITTLLTLLDRYSAKNDIPKATEFARYVISLDENSIPAQAKLGDFLKQGGDKKGASEAFFKVALIHEKQNKKEPMMEFVRRTLELNPDHSEAQKRMMGDVTGGAVPPAAGSPAAAPAKNPESVGKIPATGILDLEQEIVKPPLEPLKAVEPAPAPKPAPVEVDPLEEFKGQMAIADDYIKQGLVQEAIEIYQQLMETHPHQPEVKEKLNQAYTAYVKTGDDVIGALEAEKKAKEDEEKKIRLEMEKKAQDEAKRLRAEAEQKVKAEAEKKMRAELEVKAREEAEKKAKEEIERRAMEAASKKMKEDAERKAKEEGLAKAQQEAENKIKEEALKKAREEAERKIKEEALTKAREEVEKKAREEKALKTARAPVNEIKTSRTEPPSKGDAAIEADKDEFVTIAVADIYTRQGLYEEAGKIYRRMIQMEPDNLEARKKLTDLENLMKSKGAKTPSPEPPPSAPAKASEPPPSVPAPSPGPEKDSGGKKKSSRVGYV